MNLNDYFGILQQVSVYSGFEKPNNFDELNSLHHEKMKMNVNNQLVHICSYNKAQWKFLESDFVINTVANQKEYDYPDDGDMLRRMFITINGEPYPIVMSRNIEFLQGNTQTSRPTHFGVWEGKIVFYPIPDAVYSITVQYYSNEYARDAAGVSKQYLEDEDDVPKIPYDYRLALVFGAARDTIGRPEKPEYQHLDQQYMKIFGNLKSAQRISVDDKPTIRMRKAGRLTFDDIMNDFFSPRW